MSQYQFIINSDAPNLFPENENLLILDSDLDVVKNTETVDTIYSTLTLNNSFSKLHSLMQNNFYEPLDTQITVEMQQHLEKVNSLNHLYDVKKYLGEQEEFLTRVNYLFKILRIAPPISFLTYLRTYYYENDYTDNSIETNNLNLINRWYRDVLYSNYLIKKYVGTVSLYEYIFKSFYRFGSATIRSKYSEGGVFTPFTNKFFKLLDFVGKGDILNNSSLNYLLPDTTNSKWPYSVNIYGIKEINDLKSLDYFKYDTTKFYDEGIEYNEFEELKKYDPSLYDSGIPLGLSGSGLVLDITADYVMHHTNALFSTECIMDNPWLDYIYDFSKKAKRASDVLMIGTQVSLVATNTGQYISDPVKQQLDGEYFTHPNIKAKFQVIKTNYDINRNISFVRLGSSTYDDGISNVFADHNTDPLTCVIPTDIKVPIFEMSVGQYEVNQLGSYQNLNVVVHKNTFEKQEMINQSIGETIVPLSLTIAQSNYVGEVPTTTIYFPHKTLSLGSCTFRLEFLFTLEDNSQTKRYILIKEVYNTDLKKYIPIIYYLDENRYKLSLETVNVLVDYNEDYEYSSEITYYPSLTDNLIKVLPYETVNGLTSYCKINHIDGTLELKLMIDPTSKLNFISSYNGTETFNLDSKIECSYITNSIRSLNSSTNSISSLIGITEIGIFNTTNDMIAYGSFPPIIYDTSKYHLTFNCLMELPT